MTGRSHHDAAVEVIDLVKRYPRKPVALPGAGEPPGGRKAANGGKPPGPAGGGKGVNAVDGLSFAVYPGEIFGLLGPNGAGKSTTVGVLTTRVRATSGEAWVAGVDVRRDSVRARAGLAVVPQRPNLDRALTPRQNLIFHAAYHGIGRAERRAKAAELLDQFGLADRADDKVDWYSGGMAQRLMIARALMHEPRVLFLDEPTTGLDPQSRLFVWDRVRDMRAHGVTIVLTTHDMDEAADLTDRVGIIDHGRLLALDTPAALTRGLTGRTVLEIGITPGAGDDVEALLAALLAVDGVESGERVATGPPGMPNGFGGMPGGFPGSGGGGFGGGAPGGAPAAVAVGGPVRVRLYLSTEPAATLAPVIAALAARGGTLSDVHIGQPSLEDVFIELTGRGLR